MSEIAVVFGIAFVIVFYHMFTKDLLDKPKDAMNRKIWSYLRFKDVAVFLHILCGFMLSGFLGLLLTMSSGTLYESAISTFFVAFNWLLIGVFSIYFIIYFIFRITEELQSLGKLTRRTKK